MALLKKLKEREVRWHLIAALIFSSLLFVAGILFQEYREWCHKGAELCLASLVDFILFGGVE